MFTVVGQSLRLQ